MSLKIDDVVNGCKLEELLGKGGFGQVWRGVDSALECPVAVKIFPVELSSLNKDTTEYYARKEARLLANLRGIARVPSVYRFERFHCAGHNGKFGWTLVLEFITGSTLTSWLHQATQPRRLCGR